MHDYIVAGRSIRNFCKKVDFSFFEANSATARLLSIGIGTVFSIVLFPFSIPVLLFNTGI